MSTLTPRAGSRPPPNELPRERAEARADGIDLPDVADRRALRAGHVARTVGALALVAVVLLSLAGWFGVRSRTARARGEAVELTVRYPEIARSGVPVPLDVEVRAPGGEAVQVAISTGYLSLFESVQPQPRPGSSTSGAGGADLLLAYDVPDDGVLAVDLGGIVNSSGRWLRSGQVRVLDAEGAVLARLEVRTFVLP